MTIIPEYKIRFCLKTTTTTNPTEAGELAQWLRPQADLPEALGLISGTHMVVHSQPNSDARESDTLFWLLRARICMLNKCTCRQDTHRCRIKM